MDQDEIKRILLNSDQFIQEVISQVEGLRGDPGLKLRIKKSLLELRKNLLDGLIRLEKISFLKPAKGLVSTSQKLRVYEKEQVARFNKILKLLEKNKNLSTGDLLDTLGRNVTNQRTFYRDVNKLIDIGRIKSEKRSRLTLLSLRK